MARDYHSDLPATGSSANGGPWRFVSGGVAGNARLTGTTGVLLLLLLFLEGLTIPAVRALITPHVFLGFALIPPFLLKLASTGYRFMRYYTGNSAYRKVGPPLPLLRILAPFLVLCTVAVFVSGIMLLLVGPQAGEVWRRVHILSFILWFGLMTVHVLAYLRRAPQLALDDLQQRAIAGAMTRLSLVLASLVLGLLIAIIFLPLDASWAQWLSRIGPDR